LLHYFFPTLARRRAYEYGVRGERRDAFVDTRFAGKREDALEGTEFVGREETRLWIRGSRESESALAETEFAWREETCLTCLKEGRKKSSIKINLFFYKIFI